MNKEKKPILKWLRDYVKSLSMSTQMIFTVVFIFLIFFLLQIVLNYYFFQNYYADKEFNEIEKDLNVYIEAMNTENADYFDEMYNFTTQNNAMSVFTSSQFQIYDSLEDDYTLEITNVDNNNTFIVKVPNIEHTYTIGEIINISGFEFSQDIITPTSIISSIDGYTFDSGITCDSNCIDIDTARVDVINKPNNLNYEFENSHILQEELTLLKNGTRSLEDAAFDYKGETAYFYQTTINEQNVIVFIHELGLFDLIVTVVPIEDTQGIITIISSYNNYVYLTAILIVFAWSFRLSKVLTKPVQNIENVARQIASLNFDIDAHEYNNRENSSLSKSINLISRNLKETLNTLNNTNDELQSLYNEQIKQVSLKKQLVSSISHELKTPLMIMQVTIQGILDGIIEKQDESKELNNVLDEINKSSLMIQDMLQIYRLEDVNTTLELSEFSLSNEVNKLINDFERNLKKHNLKLDLNLDKNVIVEADLKLIKRVISNFFTNAIKYTPEGNKVYIEVSKREDDIYFELTNYGTQINQNDLDNIWMPFFRAPNYDNNRLPTKGSGIGLYLVSEILKAHGASYGISNIENGVKAFFIIKKGL